MFKVIALQKESKGFFGSQPQFIKLKFDKVWQLQKYG
jgi:hypothetical protein